VKPGVSGLFSSFQIVLVDGSPFEVRIREALSRADVASVQGVRSGTCARGVPLSAIQLRRPRGYRIGDRNVILVAVINQGIQFMANILVLNSSVLGDASASKAIVAEAVRRLVEVRPDATVVNRDLGAAPIPHLTKFNVAGIRAVPKTQAELSARALSDELIAELRAADTIVIGAPMYNFGIPTGLRAWFDHVLRAGETFSYSESGSQGLLAGKRAIVIETRGGFYREGPTRAFDFQEPYLRQLLSFIGITDVVVHVEKIAFGAEAREAALTAAKAKIAAVVKQPHADAA
jgi:FMN-dependent NADH-azoreductase